MSGNVTLTGFDELLREFEQAPDKLARETGKRAYRLAVKLAGAAREGVPVKTGQTRNSIQSYVEIRGDEIEAGARTSDPVAIYHEFGTGPVGDAHPHPQDAELGITRRPDGWVYWSDEAARDRLPGKDGEPNGFVYTEGIPARAFMYNALVTLEPEITASLGDAVLEVFAEK